MKHNQYRCDVKGLYLMDLLSSPSVYVLDFGNPDSSFLELMILAEDLWHCTITFNDTDEEEMPDFYVTQGDSWFKIGIISAPFDDKNSILRVEL